MQRLLYALLLCCLEAHGARILGIFPTPSVSHQVPVRTVMLGLAARGHQVTVITTDLLKEPVANYTEIDISFSYDYFRSNFDFTTMYDMSPTDMMKLMVTVSEMISDSQLKSESIQEFIKSLQRSNERQFDLVIIEMMMYQAYYGLHHLVGSPPIIGLITVGGSMPVYDAMGNPYNPSYSPDISLAYSDHMTFWERLHNMYIILMMKHYMYAGIMPQQETIMRKYFGDAPPPIVDTEKNFSLVLLGNDWTLGYPKPHLPNIIELAGLHVKTTVSPLPKNIKTFLDESKDGFIYFSLGSNVMSNAMPVEKREAILAAFAELPQRVLWKWESDSLPGQPSNVMVSKWLPQQDILGNPNIRLFITQGGLQSFQEASYHGVPLLGIPFLGDQHYNAKKFEAAGIGTKLDFKDLTKDNFLAAMERVLNNISYRDNMKRFSTVFRERVETSLPRAIWWTEYVLRHNGAKHLRSSALDLTWYQYLLLDVVAFVAVVLLVAVAIAFLTLRAVYRRFLKRKLKKN